MGQSLGCRPVSSAHRRPGVPSTRPQCKPKRALTGERRSLFPGRPHSSALQQCPPPPPALNQPHSRGPHGPKSSAGAAAPEPAENLLEKLGHSGLGGRSEPHQGAQRLRGCGAAPARLALPAPGPHLSSPHLHPLPLRPWLRKHVCFPQETGGSPRSGFPLRGGPAQRPAVWPWMSS